jgi:SAM-dependent methyltransferase
MSGYRLFGYSFLILFLELALIRFIPSNVRMAAYFINLVLVAAFLGMGSGLLLQYRKKDFVFLFPPILLGLFLVSAFFGNVVVQAEQGGSEFLWPSYYDFSPASKKWGIVPVISILFLFSTLVFIPLGQGMGREFGKFQPLKAYSINVAGSLIGIGAFALLSQALTGPLVWFVIAGLVFLLLCSNKKEAVSLLVCLPVVLFLVFQSKQDNEVWSPYYKIDALLNPPAITVNVNGSFHQHIMNFSDEILAQSEYTKKVLSDFKRPYNLLNSFDDVLILGAGTGNDVAVALAKGAKHVDAVEIDPEILKLGKAKHFQKPYADKRVDTYVDDARAFLKKSDKKYDLIIIGTLDSQTLLSGMTSVRLDNYVYTVESFRSIRDHLKPDGALVLYHMSSEQYIVYKIYAALAEAFDYPPMMNINEPPHLFNITLIAGNEPWKKELPEEFRSQFSVYDFSGEENFVYIPPTDDWPYLFIKNPGIPDHYWKVAAIVVVFTLLLGGGAIGRKDIRKFDGALFFLGAGFLLLETKSVTEMSLLFGSTWQVNILVFSSVLILVLLANLTAIKFKNIPLDKLFLGLFLSILVSYFVPVSSLLDFPIVGQWVLGGIQVALPLYFSSLIFATIFKTRQQATLALGYNLIGSIMGGLLEYSSMAWGTKSLYLTALVMYFLAYVKSKGNRVIM